MGTRVPFLLVAAVLAIVSPVAPAGAQTAGFEPVADGLDFAVNLALLPGGDVLIAEKTGAIRLVDDGRLVSRPVATLPVDASNNETGLLGIAVDPAFPDEPWVYAYYSDATDGINRLVRLRLDDGGAVVDRTLFEAIATTSIHNGGDLVVTPDRVLYLVTGDGAEESRSQDPVDPHGKVLRFDLDVGNAPTAHASGIRNSFGLCLDPEGGDLFQTENGPEAWDELNRIVPGANYGWPSHLGPGGEPEFTAPLFAWEQVIVATGCATPSFADEGIYVGDYRGQLHRISARDGADATDEVVATFPGGITDVAVDPRGRLWVLTTTTLHRASDPAAGGEGTRSSSDPPTSETTTASPGGEGVDDRGVGAALGSTAGLIVLALLAAGFLWLRSRALRR